MAGIMDNIVNQFDHNLMRAGYGHHIQRSPDYFATLREKAQELVGYKRQLGGDLNMRRTRSPVAPVRQGGFSSQNQGYPQQAKLSAEEREMVKAMRVAGVDEKSYLQHRLKEERTTPWKRQWHGAR
jgi:hypothetical protein